MARRSDYSSSGPISYKLQYRSVNLGPVRRHRSARLGKKVYCYLYNIYNISKTMMDGARRCPSGQGLLVLRLELIRPWLAALKSSAEMKYTAQGLIY